MRSPKSIMAPTATWNLRNGTAHVYLANERLGLIRPVILVAPTQAGGTDLTALAEGISSFSTQLRGSGYDLVLVGYNDGAAPLADLAGTATEAIIRSIAERRGSSPLSVGGIGRGATISGYALGNMESERLDHQTAVYFSYNGTAPNETLPAEAQRPRKLKLVSADFTDKLIDGDFDDVVKGAVQSEGSLITQELGQWLTERLPR